MEYLKGKGRNPIRIILKQLGVFRNKHIPDLYMTASEEDRYRLLAGLIDTDGSLHSVNRENGTKSAWQYRFSQSEENKLLSFQTKDLALSLGLSVTKMEERIKTPINRGLIYRETFRDGKTEHIHYCFTMTGYNMKNVPCLIERKKASIKCAGAVFTNANASRITITSLTESYDYVKIKVDDNHRFLLSDCTVVHD